MGIFPDASFCIRKHQAMAASMEAPFIGGKLRQKVQGIAEVEGIASIPPLCIRLIISRCKSVGKNIFFIEAQACPCKFF